MSQILKIINSRNILSESIITELSAHLKSMTDTGERFGTEVDNDPIMGSGLNIWIAGKSGQMPLESLDIVVSPLGIVNFQHQTQSRSQSVDYHYQIDVEKPTSELSAEILLFIIESNMGVIGEILYKDLRTRSEMANGQPRPPPAIEEPHP